MHSVIELTSRAPAVNANINSSAVDAEHVVELIMKATPYAVIPDALME
jgi:hypothetical protein